MLSLISSTLAEIYLHFIEEKHKTIDGKPINNILQEICGLYSNHI
jgi:hypothetical protein